MAEQSRQIYSCGAKRAYETWLKAERALKSIRRNDNAWDPELLKVYRCDYCPYFHVGHGEPK